jgi:hypothetical protein
MAARVTAAQARAMGANVPAAAKSKRRARAPYHTMCTTCDERFLTEASEARHSEETGHARYELVLTEGTA